MIRIGFHNISSLLQKKYPRNLYKNCPSIIIISRKHYNAENQPFTCTETPENTSMSLEASPIKKFR